LHFKVLAHIENEFSGMQMTLRNWHFWGFLVDWQETH